MSLLVFFHQILSLESIPSLKEEGTESKKQLKSIKTVKLICNCKTRIIVTFKLPVMRTRILVTNFPNFEQILTNFSYWHWCPQKFYKSRNDLCSDHYHPEMTSGHTIPRPSDL